MNSGSRHSLLPGGEMPVSKIMQRRIADKIVRVSCVSWCDSTSPCDTGKHHYPILGEERSISVSRLSGWLLGVLAAVGLGAIVTGAVAVIIEDVEAALA